MTQDGDERMTADTGAEDSGEERDAAEPSDEDGEEAEAAVLVELAALRDQAAANHDRYLRAVAELENVRRRAARDVENARRYGLERLAQALLPVIDSLEAGLASADQASAESLLDGKKATMRLLHSALEQVGIKEVDPHGEPFDPALHEAMAMAPSEDAEPGTVKEVFQKGYSIHDRLLRAARVVVAKEPADSGE